MPDAQEILALNQRLLDAIAAADWKAYEELCDPELTCFEPEARGNLVQGLAFHRFYFDLGASPAARNITIASPVVRFCGDDIAVVAYIRLMQKVGDEGKPTTTATEETRIWHRQGNRWRHVHFHRSAPG